MLHTILLCVCYAVYATAGTVDDTQPVLYDEDIANGAVLYKLGETTPPTPTLYDDDTKCYYKLFRDNIENDTCPKYETFQDGWRGEYMGNRKHAHLGYINQLRDIIEKQSQNIEILLNTSSERNPLKKGQDIQSLVRLQTQLANLIFEAKNQTSIQSLNVKIQEMVQALSVEIKNLELHFVDQMAKLRESVKAADDAAREKLRNKTYQIISDLTVFKSKITDLQKNLDHQGNHTNNNLKLITSEVSSLKLRTDQIETIIQTERETLKERLMNVEDTTKKQQYTIENLVLHKDKDDIRDEQQSTRIDNLEKSLLEEVSLAKAQSAKSEDVIRLERQLRANDIEFRRDLDAIKAAIANIGQPLLKQPAYVDCQDALLYYQPISGIYTLSPDTRYPFPAYCDMEGSDGWVVIQRRQDGKVDFYRGWEDYKNGFGDLLTDFYLGNKHIHHLTQIYENKLKIELYDWEGNMRYAEYDSFKIGSEEENYKLHVSGYHGNAGDALSYHNDMGFSTKDRSNDLNEGLCVEWGHGAWWYNNCYNSNLNGRYYHGGVYSTNSNWGDGVVWKSIRDTNFYSLKKVVMKIKHI